MNDNKQLDFQTIAVDFAGALCYSKWPELCQPNQALIKYKIYSLLYYIFRFLYYSAKPFRSIVLNYNKEPTANTAGSTQNCIKKYKTKMK